MKSEEQVLIIHKNELQKTVQKFLDEVTSPTGSKNIGVVPVVVVQVAFDLIKSFPQFFTVDELGKFVPQYLDDFEDQIDNQFDEVREMYGIADDGTE